MANLHRSFHPLLALIGAATLGSLAGCGGSNSMSSTPAAPVAGVVASYAGVTYVADQAIAGVTHLDSSLVNPWGIAYGPATDFWVSDQGSGKSTAYDGLGNPPVPPILVTVPAAPGSAVAGPTGVVFNATAGFLGDKFIFATLDGTLAGWSAGANATTRVDNFATNASYTGLATGSVGSVNYLYAANFTGRTIDVFDTNYAPVNLGANTLVDPALPAGFYPFGIQNLGGKLYVTYAERTPPSGHSTSGAGLGYVNVFNPDGTMVGRFAGGGPLNAPWGVALAPAGFGPFGGDLLVGNFGDGHITAYNPASGAMLGQLSDANGNPLAISGLWGLAFGNSLKAGSTGQLYFAAGTQAETHGVFGTISVGQPAVSGGTGY
jgi:uncharacterized protein (TIGR03118 family)